MTLALRIALPYSAALFDSMIQIRKISGVKIRIISPHHIMELMARSASTRVSWNHLAPAYGVIVISRMIH